ncbi:MAG: class D beta-lactamase [Chitinispirillaceae bacterium]|nr:class D beta-lactamase [Chitinispirillaceae bacterium]
MTSIGVGCIFNRVHKQQCYFNDKTGMLEILIVNSNILKVNMMRYTAILISFMSVNAFSKTIPLLDAIKETVATQDITCVFVNCKFGVIIAHDSVLIKTRYTPCSTFKIWNTLIGAECQIIHSAADSFYRWDSIARAISSWNRNLILKEAFKVSCVPAYQILARTIGNERMKKWICSIDYGDKDISSGVDDFWLPREGKKSIKISPLEQAQLIRKLLNGELTFNQQSQSVLREIMVIETTSKGVFYGKTGSGVNLDSDKEQSLGWFVGYVTGRDQRYSFACLIKGINVSGKDSKGIIESILKKTGLL